jgi:hypothetical protein
MASRCVVEGRVRLLRLLDVRIEFFVQRLVELHKETLQFRRTALHLRPIAHAQ